MFTFSESARGRKLKGSAQFVYADPPGAKMSCLEYLPVLLDNVVFLVTGNILRERGELVANDVISPENIANTVNVLKDMADSRAPILIWVPQFVGPPVGVDTGKIDNAAEFRLCFRGKTLVLA